MNYFYFSYAIILSDVQCSTHQECSPQFACVNQHCLNPCTVEQPCDYIEDCHVQDHRPICVTGKFHSAAMQFFYRMKRINCHKYTFNINSFAVSDKATGCPYCPPGHQCNPSTKTCIKGL